MDIYENSNPTKPQPPMGVSGAMLGPVCYRGAMPLRRDTTARVVAYLPLALVVELKDLAATHELSVSVLAGVMITDALANRAPPPPAPTPPGPSIDDAERVRQDPEYREWLRLHAA